MLQVSPLEHTVNLSKNLICNFHYMKIHVINNCFNVVSEIYAVGIAITKCRLYYVQSGTRNINWLRTELCYCM